MNPRTLCHRLAHRLEPATHNSVFAGSKHVCAPPVLVFRSYLRTTRLEVKNDSICYPHEIPEGLVIDIFEGSEPEKNQADFDFRESEAEVVSGPLPPVQTSRPLLIP
jgi:hypothetical protein